MYYVLIRVPKHAIALDMVRESKLHIYMQQSKINGFSSHNFSREKSKTNYYIGQQKVPVDLCHPKKIIKKIPLEIA